MSMREFLRSWPMLGYLLSDEPFLAWIEPYLFDDDMLPEIIFDLENANGRGRKSVSRELYWEASSRREMIRHEGLASLGEDYGVEVMRCPRVIIPLQNLIMRLPPSEYWDTIMIQSNMMRSGQNESSN